MLFKSSVVPAVVLFTALIGLSCGSGGSTTGPSPTPAATSTPTPTPAPVPTPIPVGPKGEYTLTFTASPSCSLPPGIEKRTYRATMQEWLEAGESRWDVSISGDEMMYGFFSGTRTGDTLIFDISYDWGYGVIEMIDQTKPLFFEGEAHATIVEGKISGAFRGRIALYDSLSTFRVYQQAPYDCQATDHKIEFVGR